MSWTQKLINVSVQLAANSGAAQPLSLTPGTIQGAGNSVLLSGNRVSARIWNAGSPVSCQAEIKVWGLIPSLMNQLATLGLTFNLVPKNIITVQAGDSSAPLTTVFQGTVYYAYGDYESQPDVPMVFGAVSGGGAIVTKATPTNFPGSASIASIMQNLAGQMGFNFVNDGAPSISLRDEYLEGTLYQQARKAAEDAGISFSTENNTLAIWNRGGSRTSLTPVTVSPGTEMIGYPAYTQQGIIVKTLYNPQIRFGGQITVQSSLPQASGTWSVYKIDHALDSLLPNGQWMSTCYAYRGPQGSVLPPAIGGI